MATAVQQSTQSEQLPFKFLRAPRVAKRIDVSVSTIWSWVKQGKFPTPVRLGPNTTCWEISSIEEWEKSRIAASK
jgi:prophage regulatory protein